MNKLIDLWIDKSNLYAKEVFCENNLLPVKYKGAERQAVVDKLIEVNHKKGWLIIVDSANRNVIVDLRKHGFHAKGASKPRNSVMDGITKIRSYNLHIVRGSTNLIKACENFFFKVDENGKIIPEIDGHEPDELAAMRYAGSIDIKSVTW